MVANLAASVEYQPYGVVGVIGPWNYPVFTPMGSIVYALAAGNAVVFKPSEFTPAVGAWLVDSFAASAVPEQPVLQLVTGAGETGAALCRSGVDKIAFTGSTATAKKIMATCAETLTPVLLECGGKDALIVAADADVDAAATAALWGGMANAGQTCIGIERVYAVDAVYDEFVAALTAKAGTLRPRHRDSYGPATMPAQLDVIRRHVDDALARGGRAVVGGAGSVRPPYAHPTVLVDVPEDSAAVHRGDVRADADRDPGGRHRRRRPQGQRDRLRPRRGRLRQGGRGGDRPPGPVRDGQRQLGPLVRRAWGRCPSAGWATPGSAGSTATTGCASSPAARPSPGSGSRPRST